MRRLAAAAAALALCACSRDLSLPAPPPPPGPGTLYGRVVYSQPGSMEKVAAAGATVQVLGTTLALATTDAQGRFLVSGITSSSGQLLVRFDPGATGVATHQLLVDLGNLGAGPGRQISLGDVVVSQNAALHGKVRRADVAAVGGHGGTVVYVPQGPFTTYTADDGTFQLSQLPAGTMSIAFFRIGYETLTLDGIALRAGEDFALRDQAIAPDVGGSAAPAQVTGHVSFDPPTSAAGTSVVAVDGLGNTFAGTVAASGDFTVAALPPGLYQITASQLGYAAARLANVLVGPGQTLVLPGIVLAETGAGGAGPLCVAGSACQPANLCRLGVVSCTGGVGACDDAGTAIDGTACGAGLVCAAGSCVPFCVGDGSTCAPANACHVGVTVCTGSGAVCGDTGVNLPNGAPCAPGKVCSSGACVDCTGPGCGVCSTACVPANRCHNGSQICGTGSAGCTDLGTNVSDGTGCGTNQVCLAGACVACAAGVICQPDNPCRTGVSSCAGGVSACVDTGNVADGVVCGGSSTCRAGVCTPPSTVMDSLARNVPASSTAAVYGPTGAVVARNGDVYFSDSNHHQVKRIPAAGGSPVVVAGTGAAGYAGDGGPATSAQLYLPKGLALDESGSGTLYVADSGNDAVRAIQLGGSGLITRYAGRGTEAVAPFGDGLDATAATLNNPTRLLLAWDRAPSPSRWLYVTDSGRNRIRRIHNAASSGGVTVPGTGVISTWLAATATCAAGVALYDCFGDPAGCSVVFDGQGNGFVSGRTCGGVLGGSVTYGVLRVSPSMALAPVAGSAAGTAAEGINARLAAFGASPALAIDAAGNLYTADPQTNRVRRLDGASGRIETVVNPTGAAGSAGDGWAGNATTTTLDRPWDLAFDTGTPPRDLVVTENAGNVVRIARGAGLAVEPTVALVAVSGDGQSVGVGQVAPLPLSVRLLDGGGAPLAGYAISFASLTPGGSVSAGSVSTDGGGYATVTARAGQAPGSYRFSASFTDLHGRAVGPPPFTLQALPFAPGTIQAVVNAARTSALDPEVSGPAILSSTRGPRGLVAASDGTLYFADESNHQVKAVAPSGLISRVAGAANGSPGIAGDGGPATAAQLYYPKALALDESARVLYVAESGNDRIRAVDLVTGTISTLAGGGTAVTAPYGDGRTATDATFNNPSQLSIHDDAGVRWLYVTDYGRGRIRRIQLSGGAGAGVIGAAFGPTATCDTSTPAVTWYDCYPEHAGCSHAWDALGNVFVSGRFCSSELGSYAPGIVRIGPDGRMVPVAGKAGGTTAEGVSARAAAFSSPPAIAVDAAGNLLVADPGNHRVRRIDGTTGRIDTVAGTGAATSTGDGGAATAATLNTPIAVALDAATLTTLYVSDYTGNAVRLVTGAGTAARTPATLAAAGPTSEVVGVSLEGAPLAVRLTSAGAPLGGYRVAFTSLDVGASLSAPSVLTGADGVAAAATPRAGLAPGAYRFQASFDDLHGVPVAGSPVAFTLAASAPALGNIAAIVDLDRVSGNTGVGGPASTARIRGPTGVAVASDGTVFFADFGNHQVKAIAPTGILSLVAGDPAGGAGFTGDGGPATAAKLNNPRGLALDEEALRLYVADWTNDRVRVVDLVGGTISTFAGGGVTSGPGWGDGGTATGATLAGPNQVVVWRDPGGAKALYVTDGDHQRVRRVDLDGPNAGVITPFITPVAGCGGALGWNSCTSNGGNTGCSVVLDGPGTGFVSGYFCGSEFGGNAYGVARFGPGGVLVAQVAGSYLGSGTHGISARSAAFVNPPALAVDAAGNLYTSDWGGHEVRRIDGASGRIESVLGTGTAGSTGDGGPATLATLNNPYLLAFDPATGATLYVAEYNGNTVRVVRGLGRTVPSTALLTLTGGATQPAPVYVDQVAPAPLAVTLTDGAGAPLAGFRVDFSSATPGGSVAAARVQTSGSGVALTPLRAGQLPQAYRFRAEFRDIRGRLVPGAPANPAAVDVNALAPSPLTAFVAVNGLRVSGNGIAGEGGPAVLAQVYQPKGAAMASDGTFFFSDSYNHKVKAVAPSGLLTVVAGTGTCGLSGDGGEATRATLCYPTGLALDEANGLLYLADSNYDRVRVVNLRTGIISAVAGGGTATAAPWGDGGPATSGVLSNPTHVRLHGGKLYVGDIGHNLVRVVNLDAVPVPTIATFVKARSPINCPTGGLLPTDMVFSACGSDQGCDVAFDQAGDAYVSGSFCGGVQMGGYYFNGIGRTADGVGWEHVAGRYSTPPAADGSAATATPLAGPPSLEMGSNGKLYYLVAGEHALRVVDLSLATPTVATVAGAVPAPAPVAGNGADYVPAGSLRLSSPWGFALQPGGGHAVISDTGNDAVRLVW